MSQPAIVTIKQLTSRLENATSMERLGALQELQVLARSESELVGECALQKVLDFLKEQGSSEEYQESLDLIDRLIKTKDRNAATLNTRIIFSVVGNVELLLGLLQICRSTCLIIACHYSLTISSLNSVYLKFRLRSPRA